MDESAAVLPELQRDFPLGSGRSPGAPGSFNSRLRLLALCVYAKDFLSAAKSAQPLRGTCGPARLHLLCQALELALTAYLLAHGVHTPDDSSAAAKDLGALWSEAQACGLDSHVQLTRTARTHVRKAAAYYSAGYMQRPALSEILRGSSGAPDYDQLERAVTTLVSAVNNVASMAALETFDREHGK